MVKSSKCISALITLGLSGDFHLVNQVYAIFSPCWTVTIPGTRSSIMSFVGHATHFLETHFLREGSHGISVKALKFIFIKLFNKYFWSIRSCARV